MEYELEVYADLKNSESAEAAIVKFTAKEQPELMTDAASNVHIMYGSISVSKKRDITDVTRGVVRANLDEILVDKDCKSVQKAFVLFKTEDKDEWSKEELDTTGDSFEKDLNLPDYCKKYMFKLIFHGFPGTESIILDLETTLGPADIDQTGLERLPVVEDMQVVTGVDTARILWRQPDCVPAYEFVVYSLEDCADEEEFKDCFEDAATASDTDTFDLELVFSGEVASEDNFETQISNLDTCNEYIIMARTTNEYGKSKIAGKLFRARETDSEDEDLANLAIVGLQEDGSFYPTVTNLQVVPGVNSAVMGWRQPECFADYELQVVNIKDCKDGSFESCLAEFSPDIEDTTEKKTNKKSFESLEPCTEYVAMARTTGRYDHRFGKHNFKLC